jgi:hypothetical protein
MAIKVLGTSVIDDSRNLVNIVDATITGDLTVDTNTLIVDSTNNRVGVRTTPTVDFEVNGIIRSDSLQDSAGNSLVIRDSVGTLLWGS